MYLPEWVQKFKEPRTEIKKINNSFYKYEVAFIYNKEKKKTEKKTVRLLGKITEKDGFVPSQKDELRRKSADLPTVDIKTFGIYNLFSDLMKDEIASLTEAFGNETAEELLSFAMMRWAYQSPIKRAPYYHSHDFCSEHWVQKSMTDKTISTNLKYFGENREKVVAWMQTLLGNAGDSDQNFVLMDSTHSMSASENIAINAKGYNSNFDFEKQVRLMYLFSTQMQQPVYYRLINGNITDVKSMALCVNEMNVKDKTVFIADKGFYSADNVAMMDAENLSYIIPLQRNNSLIDLKPFEMPNFKQKLRYFVFENRIIWYHSYQKENYQITTFLDERLRVEEERDYLLRIESRPESYSKEKFDEKLMSFGTLTIIHNITQPVVTVKKKVRKNAKEVKPKSFEQTIFEAYKQRNDIEVMFDSYKNYLKADATYMQNRFVLEGWLFANFIAMIAYYKLYTRLKQADLLSKLSPKDIIEMSKAIGKVKIRGTWNIAEITQKVIKIFKKINIDYLK
jgi:transposase